MCASRSAAAAPEVSCAAPPPDGARCHRPAAPLPRPRLRSYQYTSPNDMQTHNATYYFNIGANAIPTTGSGIAACLANRPAAAYQVVPGTGQYSGCYELTADMSQPVNLFTRSLFDAANPARGWQIKASGGSSQFCGSARSFTWVYMCDKTNPTPPLFSNNHTFVEEISGCSYAAFMYSQVGCPLGACLGGRASERTRSSECERGKAAVPGAPLNPPPPPSRLPPRLPPTFSPAECPRTPKGVCNNQGVCGYDWTASTARCYCNSGYNVADCSSTSSPPSGGAIFAALGGGAVIGALGIVAYSYFAYRGAAAKAPVAAADGFYPG